MILTSFIIFEFAYSFGNAVSAIKLKRREEKPVSGDI